MSRYEQVQERLPGIISRRKKADSFDTIVPMMLETSVIMAADDRTKGREIASMAAPIADVITPIAWAAGMYTGPGAFVYSPDGKWTYMYSGKAGMTHANQTFFPGSTGVYYWAVVPKMHEEKKVFPDISGIVVFIKKNELWWNPAKTKLYKWTGDNYDCPSNYYPGAAGVHSWTEVKT